MKQTSISMKRILAFVLVFCLLTSMFPSMGLAGLASAAEPDDSLGLPAPLASAVTVATEAQLLDAIEHQTEIYLLPGELRISKPTKTHL